MHLILIPGFWLDASSWDEVAAPLQEAGHIVDALTLPGLESRDADRSSITLRDHIDAVVSVIDSLAAPVVLVGHSGGGAIAHASVDARPASVARVIYVDTGPTADGTCINDELTVVNGEIALPDWSAFPDEDLVDFDDAIRARFRSIAISQPARVATDPQVLRDPRRYDIPVTVICCEFTAAQLCEWIGANHPNTTELARIRDVEFIDLPTGHWPQFTRPVELASIVLRSIPAS